MDKLSCRRRSKFFLMHTCITSSGTRASCKNCLSNDGKFICSKTSNHPTSSVGNKLLLRFRRGFLGELFNKGALSSSLEEPRNKLDLYDFRYFLSPVKAYLHVYRKPYQELIFYIMSSWPYCMGVCAAIHHYVMGLP